MGSVGAVVDEWKIETQRHAKWFEDAKAGNNSELERTIGGRPPEDYKGFTYEWVSFKGQDERTAFFLAAEAGHLHTVQMLAQRGADVREVDPGGETALHAAAGNNHAEVIRWLLAQGVPIDAQSRSGGTALLRAASKSHQLAVAHLLVAKASVDLADTHKNTALINATRDNKLDVAALLLFHGASVHATNSMNETPVTYAQERMTELLWSTTAKRGDVPGLRRLLARQIGAKGDEGWTELNRALFQPQGQDTHKLSMHRILCNCKEEHGFTGLSLAVQGGHVPAAECASTAIEQPAPCAALAFGARSIRSARPVDWLCIPGHRAGRVHAGTCFRRRPTSAYRTICARRRCTTPRDSATSSSFAYCATTTHRSRPSTSAARPRCTSPPSLGTRPSSKHSSLQKPTSRATTSSTRRRSTMLSRGSTHPPSRCS